MSWLFDRLCELASTDCVQVVVIADLGEPDVAGAAVLDDAVDLVEVLVRASQIPQTTVDVFAPVAVTPPLFATGDTVIDLEGLGDGHRARVVKEHLRRLSQGRVAHVRIRRDELAVSEQLPTDAAQSWHPEPAGAGDPRWRQVVVTDQPGHGDLLARAAPRGLAIAVGGVDPSANMQVSDILGVSSVLDALVTLRYFAFGLTCDLAAVPD